MNRFVIALLFVLVPAVALAAPDAGPAAAGAVRATPPGAPADLAGALALAAGPAGLPWFAVGGALLFAFVRALKGQAGFPVPWISERIRALTPATQAIAITVASVVGWALWAAGTMPAGGDLAATIGRAALDGLLAAVVGAGFNSQADAVTRT